MRKFYILLIGISTLISFARAQNGFEMTDLDVDFSKYAIDQSGNYWLLSGNELLKYNGSEILSYDETNSNMVFDDLRDLIIHDNGMYVVTNNKIYDFNMEDPQQSVDLGINEAITSAYLSGGRLIVFSAPSMPTFTVKVYNDGEWSMSDTLPAIEAIKGAAYFHGNYYIIIRNIGLYQYDLDDFTLISEKSLYDIQVWNDMLWFIDGSNIYFLENGQLHNIAVASSVNGGSSLNVMNNQLWASQPNQIIRIESDRIKGFELSANFKVFPSCLASHNPIEFSSGQNLITFDPEAYISDPNFINLENIRFLNVNNVEAVYNIRNSIFWDLTKAQYHVPKDGNVSSMFATSIWFGGKDSEDHLHVSADKFDINSIFNAGPLRLNDAGTDAIVTDQYNKIWKIDRATIENFKYRFENGQVQNGSWPIDYDIESWPAHGPEGYAENLAPFVDVNEDGVYNPIDGDYPDIEGDQMLFWIMNDNYDGRALLNNNQISPALGIEIHCKAWANVYEGADSDELEAINNATFLDVEIINRSDTTYTDFYSALWTDGDLGYSDDDYVGSDVMNHSYMFYNGDDFDDAEGDPSGYGLNPPSQSVTFLDAPVKYTIPEVDTGIYMSSFIFHNRGGEDPEFAADYYNYMMAKWKDSAAVTYGGNGIDTTDIPCRYMFPGNSDPYNIGTDGVAVPEWNDIWTMNSGIGTPSDVRGVAANGPYTLEPGQKVTYRFAFVWARDTISGTAVASLDKLRELLPYFHQWQREGEFPSNYNIHIVPIGINEQPASTLGVKLYPNPASNCVTLICDAANAHYKIYSLSGRLMGAGQIRNSSQQITLDRMNQGLYMVQITNGEATVTEKLIVE